MFLRGFAEFKMDPVLVGELLEILVLWQSVGEPLWNAEVGREGVMFGGDVHRRS